MTYVPPDGPVPCKWAMVGEAPAGEEVKQGRGFVGPSGTLIWPLMRRLALLDRAECYVTNLCKHELDNDVSGDLKLSPEEFDECKWELVAELGRVRPERVLAVGALAAKALLGERYVGMDVCNGMGFDIGGGTIVVPTWHPAAALRGGEGQPNAGLTHTAAAIVAFARPVVKMCPAVEPDLPPPLLWTGEAPYNVTIGMDTEGTPDDPICMTFATWDVRWYVEPQDVPTFFASLPPNVRILFHNAPWDWPVLRAMGAPADLHLRWPWADTMELAYLRQTEPRGLKDLAYRHLGLRMRTFEQVVRPYHDEMLGAVARGRVEAGTTTVTLSPKGRTLKRPKLVLTEDAKRLKRALANPKLLAERMPGLPPLTLRIVPGAEAREYATLDAWATVMLEPHLREGLAA